MSFEEIITRLNSLDSGDTIGICAHTRPDGDAVGSVLGLTLALRAASINAIPLLADRARPPRTYNSLAGFEFYQNPDTSENKHFKLLVVLDTPTLDRLGQGSEYLARSDASLLMDHHPPHETFTDSSWVDTEYAATALMVWQLLTESRYAVNREVATACLTGVFSDTGSFRYQKTDARVFRAAAEMVEAGAIASDISNTLYHSRSRGIVELEALVLKRLSFANGGAVGYSFVTDADYGATNTLREEGEDLVDLIRSIDEVDVAFLITLGKHAPRVSLRSKTDFDVAHVARRFGGGGHRPAAGLSWPNVDATVEDILHELLPLLPSR